MVLVDLDRDEAPELCSAWLSTASGKPEGLLRVHDLRGRQLLELTCGARPFYLAPGSGQLPLIGSGERTQAWGPWTPLPSATPRRQGELWNLYVAGAYRAALEGARRSQDPDLELLTALAAWQLGQREELAALRAAGPLAEHEAKTRIEARYRAGERLAAERLAAPFGWALNPPPTPPWSPLTLGEAPRGAPLVSLDLGDPELPARGVLSCEVAGGRFRQGKARELGLFLGVGARLRLRFELPPGRGAELRLLHWSIPNYVPGYASYRLHLDGAARAPRLAPAGTAAQLERIDLGPLAPGEHLLELELLPGAQTLYDLSRLEVVRAGP